MNTRMSNIFMKLSSYVNTQLLFPFINFFKILVAIHCIDFTIMTNSAIIIYNNEK